MRTKPVSPPSLTRLHSNSLDLSLQQLNNTPVHFNNCVNPTHKGPKDMTLFQDVNLHRPKNQLRKVRKLKIILLICLILRKIWKRNNTRAFNHTKVSYYLRLWRIQGRGPGSPPLSPLFLDQTEAEKNFFWDWAYPLSQGLDDCPTPPPPPLSKGLDPTVSVTSSTRYSELAGSYGIQFKIWKEVFLSFLFLCFAFSFWYDNAVWPCVIAYMLWFNFILNSNFIFITASHSLSYIIIPPKKQRTKWL